MFEVQRLIRVTITILSLGTASLMAPASFADESAETIAALRAQLEALSARLERLESQQQSTPVLQTSVQDAPVAAKPEKKALKIKYNADLRYRFESFDIENTPDRHRNRVRARFGLTAPVSDTTQLGFALASGSDDPVSSNQTLGDNFSSKQVNIDQAFVRWQPLNSSWDIYAGKFKNPLERAAGNGLLWDGDLRPEGLAAQYAQNDLFFNALGTWINESKSGDDLLLLGAQAGIEKKVFGSSSLIAGVGFYQYTGIEGSAELMPGKALGNRLTADGRYLSSYDLLESFAELNVPTSFGKAIFYADYVQNLGADAYDTGYVLGTKIGFGDWSLGWAYEDIEADAVYAMLTDSDFGGGGTDAEGHKLEASFALSKKVKLVSTLFLNDRNVDFGVEQEFRRFMFDVVVKY